MIKAIITICILSYTLLADNITWVHSYKNGVQLSKTNNKPMILFINREGCGACEFMQENVFTDEMIYTYINEEFIPVSLDIETNDAPNDLQAYGTPTFQFVNHKGIKLRDTLVGGKTGKFFLNILKEAVENYKKN